MTAVAQGTSSMKDSVDREDTRVPGRRRRGPTPSSPPRIASLPRTNLGRVLHFLWSCWPSSLILCSGSPTTVFCFFIDVLSLCLDTTGRTTLFLVTRSHTFTFCLLILVLVPCSAGQHRRLPDHDSLSLLILLLTDSNRSDSGLSLLHPVTLANHPTTGSHPRNSELY